MNTDTQKQTAAGFIVADMSYPYGFYVCAPVGYFRDRNGKMVKDGTPSPEWAPERRIAYVFPTHRAAARTANRCGSSVKIIPV